MSAGWRLRRGAALNACTFRIELAHDLVGRLPILVDSSPMAPNSSRPDSNEFDDRFYSLIGQVVVTFNSLEAVLLECVAGQLGPNRDLGVVMLCRVTFSGSEQETVKAYPFIEFAVEASLCGCSGMPKLVSWASMFPD